MSKKPLFFDFSNVGLSNIGAWAMVTLPIRVLGRIVIDSGPEARTYRRAASDEVAGETSSASRHSID